MELALSIIATSISVISIVIQLINNFKRIYLEVNDIFLCDGINGSQYVFRLTFLNKSYSSISISKISIKYKNYIQNFDYEKTILFTKTKSHNREVIDKRYLYSREMPFRIDGLGADGGYFSIWNLPEPELLNNNGEVEMLLNTNRGKITCKIKLPTIKNPAEIKFD